MFQGITHENARKILVDLIPEMPANVHVIGSGNFTIESILRLNDYTGNLSGCDVSIYTSAIGMYLSDNDIPLTLNLDKFPDLEVFLPHLEDMEGKAAVIMILMDLLQHYERKNLYQERMFHAYMNRIDELVEKTRIKLKSRRELIEKYQYTSKDGWEVAGEIPPGEKHLIITFPPLRPNEYENQYKTIDKVINWDKPFYNQLSIGEDYARKIIEREGPWIIIAEERIEDMESILGDPFAQVSRGLGGDVYLYSNVKRSVKIVRRGMHFEESNLERMTEKDEITKKSRIWFKRIKSSQANYIRQLFISHVVMQASAQYNFVIMVDGKVCGLLMFSEPSAILSHKEKEEDRMYLMADFPIDNTRYIRLSKLILLLSLTKEMKRELDGLSIRNVREILTTAFSKHPVSMKYRGVYKLAKKTETSKGYDLNYLGKTGKYTIKEVLLLWLQKHSKTRKLENSKTRKLKRNIEQGFKSDLWNKTQINVH